MRQQAGMRVACTVGAAGMVRPASRTYHAAVAAAVAAGCNQRAVVMFRRAFLHPLDS